MTDAPANHRIKNVLRAWFGQCVFIILLNYPAAALTAQGQQKLVRKICSDTAANSLSRTVVQTHPRMMLGNVLEWNRGGRARRIQCGAPHRHYHGEIWLRCRNSKRGGSRTRRWYAQRRRETAEIQEWGNDLFGRIGWQGVTAAASG
jgi:hypothetical protein